MHAKRATRAIIDGETRTHRHLPSDGDGGEAGPEEITAAALRRPAALSCEPREPGRPPTDLGVRQTEPRAGRPPRVAERPRAGSGEGPETSAGVVGWGGVGGEHASLCDGWAGR